MRTLTLLVVLLLAVVSQQYLATARAAQRTTLWLVDCTSCQDVRR